MGVKIPVVVVGIRRGKIIPVRRPDNQDLIELDGIALGGVGMHDPVALRDCFVRRVSSDVSLGALLIALGIKREWGSD